MGRQSAFPLYKVTTRDAQLPIPSDIPLGGVAHLESVCRGDTTTAKAALATEDFSSVATCLATISIGCSLYGATLGLWRAPLQAAFVAVKLPLLIGLTLIINGMLNGMLALILGSGLTFRQTLHGCLMGFTIFSLIVGSLSPVLFFMVINAPPATAPEAAHWHAVFLLVNVVTIAGAGIAGNVKLFTVLHAFAGDAIVALRVLLAWLAGNLFVGAQLSWILRPMMGNPTLEVQFLRSHPFDGNFYQDVLNKLCIAGGIDPESSMGIALVLTTACALLCILCWQILERRMRHQIDPAATQTE
ncbi:MAG: hypothetical protein KDN22_25210 [Verrucomicrobiae bacterium]|nr:hypothetical protein [Verrucomicrobiae bacterium]